MDLNGIVSEYLTRLVSRQVDDHGLVVWYDPEGAYGGTAEALSLPNTVVARYHDSFFRLRREVDPLLDGGRPPRLVVYVPMAPSETHNALVELEAAGVVMLPGRQPPNRNTKLAVVARNALRPVASDDQLGDIEKQIEAGMLSLADLDALGVKGQGLSGILSLVFGSANPHDVALAVLHDDRYDEEIEKKSAADELAKLIAAAYELEAGEKPQMNTDEHRFIKSSSGASRVRPWLDCFRERLARHVLVTDLVATIGEALPPALASIPCASSQGGVDACLRLARSWRNDRRYRESYVAAANTVEKDLKLGEVPLDPSSLEKSETFLAVEHALLRHVEGELCKAADPERYELALARQSRFWAEAEPTVQARWALVAAAAEVLLEADRVAGEIKTAAGNVGEFVKNYAEASEPWCRLDTAHRHLETRKYHFEFETSGDHQTLDRLIAKAEHRYLEVGSAVARHFVTALAKATHPIAGVPRQRDFFQTQVKPRLREGKIAYVWVDALRFEMARELVRLLESDFELDIRPALATPPTITEIGMASLLPKAHESAKLVGLGGGKLALEIGGQMIKDRKDRVAFLKQHAGATVFDCKLDDLLPKPNKRVRDGIQAADLVLVTSQEIDELCEADNIAQARLQMDGVLGHLRRGFRILSDQGIKTIVLAADHGHLFADEIGDDMKIDAPGGDTADLHRRVWVGVGGTSQPSYLRTSLSSLGVESDLDLATPWTFACFRSKGGARAYFHGGLSPQEMIIPLVVLKSRSKLAGKPPGVQWALVPGSKKLTTRFFSVQITGTQSAAGLFGFEPPKVRVEVRAGKRCVSVPVSASYGFEDATGDVQLRADGADPRAVASNTVALMIAETPEERTVSIHLLDAATQVELASERNVPVEISI